MRKYKVDKNNFNYSFKIDIRILCHQYRRFMQPSKTTLNLPSSSFHLCSPLKEICRVKIHNQFTSFPK